MAELQSALDRYKKYLENRSAQFKEDARILLNEQMEGTERGLLDKSNYFKKTYKLLPEETFELFRLIQTLVSENKKLHAKLAREGFESKLEGIRPLLNKKDFDALSNLAVQGTRTKTAQARFLKLIKKARIAEKKAKAKAKAKVRKAEEKAKAKAAVKSQPKRRRKRKLPQPSATPPTQPKATAVAELQPKTRKSAPPGWVPAAAKSTAVVELQPKRRKRKPPRPIDASPALLKTGLVHFKCGAKGGVSRKSKKSPFKWYSIPRKKKMTLDANEIEFD